MLTKNNFHPEILQAGMNMLTMSRSYSDSFSYQFQNYFWKIRIQLSLICYVRILELIPFFFNTVKFLSDFSVKKAGCRIGNTFSQFQMFQPF